MIDSALLQHGDDHGDLAVYADVMIACLIHGDVDLRIHELPHHCGLVVLTSARIDQHVIVGEEIREGGCIPLEDGTLHGAVGGDQVHDRVFGRGGKMRAVQRPRSLLVELNATAGPPVRRHSTVRW